MKIAAYAICKNEKPNVEEWLKTVVGADYVTVADTGSDDGTYDEFEAKAWRYLKPAVFNLHHVSIKPWRFDDARNAALALVPDDADVCVCLDLDDRISENWADIIRNTWQPETTSGFYLYQFNPQHAYFHSRIHKRHGYRWRYPAHEGVYPYSADGAVVPEHKLTYPQIVVTQTQDPTKDRSNVLALLQLGLRENPNSARMHHYLGRELMYLGRYKEALVYLQRYYAFPDQVFNVEAAANADCIARCWRGMK